MNWTQEPTEVGWYIWATERFAYSAETAYWDGECLRYWDSEDAEWQKFFPPFHKDNQFLLLGEEVLEWKTDFYEY